MKLKKVSVEGLPLIGEGITASVYRLDDDKVIVVYLPGIPVVGMTQKGSHRCTKNF